MRKRRRVVDFKQQEGRSKDQRAEGKKKYHYEIGFPQTALAQVKRGKIRLEYTYHAQQEAMSDRYGVIHLPVFLDTHRAKIIEIETDKQDKVIKVLYRAHLDTERDLLLAVIPQGDKGKVKTVWVNKKWDRHRTLDRKKYDYPYRP
jgi:hypothetical protein